MKKFAKILAVLLIVVMAFTVCACNTKGGGQQSTEGKNILSIYGVNQGFGVASLENTIEAFKNTDWVKEKYPDLEVRFQYNDVESFAVNKIKGGEGVNEYDLMFSAYLSQFNGTGNTVEITDSVINAEIPGESGVKVKDKMTETDRLYTASLDEATNEYKYYTLMYSGGIRGYIYNHELLTDLGYQMPVTTDELLEQTREITAMNTPKYSKGYAWMSSKEGNDYFAYAWNQMVCQYMGVEGYNNFFNGIDSDGRRTKNIFEDQGRLRVLQYMEELYDYNNHYVSSQADELDFMAAQLGFLKGEGVFMPNGSWYSNEMANLRGKAVAAGQKVYDIRYMKTPVISAIIEVLPDKSIEDDETLRAVVRAIDAGEDHYDGVTADDFRRVAEARTIVDRNAQSDVAIPSTSTHKELAADFLVFMASDVGIEAYYHAGFPSVFKYDVKTKNPTLYNSLNSFDKSRIESYYGNAIYGYEIPVPAAKTRLSTFGGIDLIRRSYTYFYADLSVKNKSTSAQKIFDDTNNYWTDEMFQEARKKAGY